MERKLELRKPFVYVAAALVALLFLAVASGASSATANRAAASGKTTLTVWTFMPAEYANGTTAYNNVVKAFEAKYPKVTVSLVNIPYPTYFQGS